MDKYWVVVANASRAYIYGCPQKEYKNWNLIYSLSHAPSRMKRGDLMADVPGHPKKSIRHVHGVYDEQVDVKELEADHFAKEIAYILNKNLEQLKFKALMLAAPQHFYGLLRKYLDKSVKMKNSLKKTIKKDYSRLNMEGLGKVFFKERSPRKADQCCTKKH